MKVADFRTPGIHSGEYVSVDPDEMPVFLAIMFPFMIILCCGCIAIVRLLHGDITGALIPSFILMIGFFMLLIMMIVFRP